MMKSVLTLVSGREDRVLRRVRISEISRNPNQPRRYFDPEAIATLAESIRQYGVLNPLTVRRTAGGGYELVAGERRLRAARVAGLTDVPCLLINADGEDSSVIALVENLQRRDLDFFEEANGFKRLIDQFGLTQHGQMVRDCGSAQLKGRSNLHGGEPAMLELLQDRPAGGVAQGLKGLMKAHTEPP